MALVNGRSKCVSNCLPLSIGEAPGVEGVARDCDRVVTPAGDGEGWLSEGKLRTYAA